MAGKVFMGIARNIDSELGNITEQDLAVLEIPRGYLSSVSIITVNGLFTKIGDIEDATICMYIEDMENPENVIKIRQDTMHGTKQTNNWSFRIIMQSETDALVLPNANDALYEGIFSNTFVIPDVDVSKIRIRITAEIDGVTDIVTLDHLNLAHNGF